MYNRQLETFIRVADAGSFNKAAESLYISFPAVIKQINLLEANLNVRLFARSYSGLTLTEAGKSLYRDAKYVIQYCRDSVARAQNAMQNESHLIRVGTSSITSERFLVDIWSKVRDRCPDIRLQFVSFESEREILKHIGENIDITIGIMDQMMQHHFQYSGIKLVDVPIYCAVSIYHRLAEKEKLQIEDLYGERLMLIQRGKIENMDRLRDDIRLNHPQIHLVNIPFYDTSVFNQCENENNVLIVASEWKNIHPFLKIIPIQWEHTLSFGLIHSLTPTPVVQRFLDAVNHITHETSIEL